MLIAFAGCPFYLTSTINLGGIVMTITHQKHLATILGSRLVSYNVTLSEILGSITASIFLNQLLYWYERGNDREWVYKTVLDFEDETGLTEAQQLSAQKRLVSMGIIEVKRKGSPPKRHFKINVDRLYKVCNDFLAKRQKSGQSNDAKPVN